MVLSYKHPGTRDCCFTLLWYGENDTVDSTSWLARTHWATLWLEGAEEVQAKVESLRWPATLKAFERSFLMLRSHAEPPTGSGDAGLGP